MDAVFAESPIHSGINQGKPECGRRLFEQTSLKFAGVEKKLEEVSSGEGDDVTKFIALRMGGGRKTYGCGRSKWGGVEGSSTRHVRTCL